MIKVTFTELIKLEDCECMHIFCFATSLNGNWRKIWTSSTEYFQIEEIKIKRVEHLKASEL